MHWLILGCLGAGAAYASIGFAFHFAEKDHVTPHQLAIIQSLAGGLFCLALAWRAIPLIDAPFAAVSLATGVAQYLAVRLQQPALARGPFSLMLCAQMLVFVPATCYGWLFLGETATVWSVLAAAAAIAAVIVGALAADGGTHAAISGKWRAKLLYGALLLAMLILGAESNIANKALEQRSADFAAVSNVWLLLLFTGLFACSLADNLARRAIPWRSRNFYLGGGIAGACSLTGMSLQNMVMAGPASLVFTLINASGIVAAALIGTLLRREKRDAAWFAGLLLALAAIALSQGGSLFGES